MSMNTRELLLFRVLMAIATVAWVFALYQIVRH